MGTVLAYAGPDMIDDLAQSIEQVMTKVGVRVPADPT
jgi:hypothetical protein